MNENLKHNKAKQPKIYWDLGIIITIFILMSWFYIARRMIWYRFGLTLSPSWQMLFCPHVLLVLFSMGLISISIIRLAFLNIRFGIKRLLLQIAFVIVAIGVFKMPPIFNQNAPGFEESFYENMKANADFDAIQDWLDSFDWNSLEKREVFPYDLYLPSSSWPDAIKKLPNDLEPFVYLMKSANNKIYVRVEYGGRAVIKTSGSLVVGVGANEIPSNDFYESAYRRELAPNAFVGFRRR